MAVPTQGRAAGLPSPAFNQFSRRYQGRAESRGRSALYNIRSLVCQVDITLAEVFNMPRQVSLAVKASEVQQSFNQNVADV